MKNVVMVVMLASCLLTKVASAEELPSSGEFEALKVKSAAGARLDPTSRENLVILTRDNRQNGPTPVWVILNMRYDSSLLPETGEYALQRQAFLAFWNEVATDLRVDPSRITLNEAGPYVTFDASIGEMQRLSRHTKVLGFYGLIGTTRVSQQNSS